MGFLSRRRNGNRHIFYTVFASVMLLALVPIFFLSVSFYYKSYRDIAASVSEFQESYLEEFDLRFDNLLADSIRQARELAQSAAIQNLEQYPDTPFYENIVGPFSQEALYGLYQYLQVKKAFFTELRSFSLRHEYVSEAKYYINRLEWVLTSLDYGYHVGTRAGDEEWYEWYLHDDTSVFKVYFPSRDTMVLAVKPLFWERGDPCVIIYIDLDVALADIIDSLPDFPEKGTLVLDRDTGEELFSYASAGFDSADPPSKMTTIIKPLPGTSTVVSLAISKDEFARRLSGIGTIALLSAALVLLIIVFGVLISLRIARPIARLAAMVGRPAAIGGNEVQQIEHGLTTLMLEKSALEERVRTSIPIYRENFLRGMLFGEIHTQAEIEGQFAFLDIPVEPSNIIVLVLLLELNTKEEHAQRTQALRAKTATHQLLVENGNGLEIEFSKNRIAIVMNGTTKTQKKVLVFADAVLEALDGLDEGEVHIGVGYPYESHEMIRRSFEEAEEALNYVSLQPDSDNRVFFIGDIRLVRTRPFIYPVEQETRLSNMIMSGNRQAALETFALLRQNFQQQRLILHKYRIHHIMLRIMNMIYDRYSEVDPTYKVPVDQYISVIEKMEAGRENDVFEFLESVIADLSDKIRNSHAEKEFVIVSRICEKIESEYSDVSLQTVSDELSLSTSLVSKLFKKVKGVGFSEYLTSYRVEKGLELLKSTDLSVGQISKKLGYSNSNYFIRIFREHNDITPGDYRKAFQGKTAAD